MARMSISPDCNYRGDAMSITNKLNQIKNAIYGKEVRGAIHDAIKQVYDDASVNHDNANMEVKLARGTHTTLNDRLDKSDEIQAQTNAQLSMNKTTVTLEEFGAVGDGVTNDKEALIACLSLGNVSIKLKRKTYLIDGIIEIDGVNNINIMGNGATLKCKNGVSVAPVGNKGFINFVNCDNLEIRDLNINTNGQWIKRPFYGSDTYESYLDLRSRTYENIRLEKCNNFSLINITGENSKTGMFIGSCKVGNITDCVVKHTLSDGFFITGRSEDVKVKGCSVIYGGDDCYSADGYGSADQNPTRIIFMNCTAYSCFGALTCLHGCTYCSTIGCTAYGCNYTPIKLGNLDDTGVGSCYQLVSDCTIYVNSVVEPVDGSGGRYISPLVHATAKNPVSNITINNVVIKSTTIVPFELTCNYCNNLRLSNVTADGITLKFAYTTNIFLNGCELNLGDCLRFTSCNQVNVTQNHIKNNKVVNYNGNATIWFNECNNVVCCNNGKLEEVSFYSNTQVENFICDAIKSVFNSNCSKIKYLGVYTTNDFLTPSNYVEGQMVIRKDTNQLMVVVNNSFLNIGTIG